VNDTPIRIRKLLKRYPRFTLGGIDLDVARGRVLGLIGPNGAGKSTLLRLMMGLVRADSGEIAILGRPMPAEER
jgi:ABC-type multidrug transport system ATPase subunit